MISNTVATYSEQNGKGRMRCRPRILANGDDEGLLDLLEIS